MKDYNGNSLAKCCKCGNTVFELNARQLGWEIKQVADMGEHEWICAKCLHKEEKKVINFVVYVSPEADDESHSYTYLTEAEAIRRQRKATEKFEKAKKMYLDKQTALEDFIIVNWAWREEKEVTK